MNDNYYKYRKWMYCGICGVGGLQEDGWKPHIVAVGATRFLESIITKDFEILELGSGSSTLWFASRAKKIISYEHNETWYQLVIDEIKNRGITNVDIRYDPNYPKEGIKNIKDNFNIILIDGRGRVRNLMITYKLLKPRGYFILDDSQRDKYKEGIKFLDDLGWKRKDFLIKDKKEYMIRDQAIYGNDFDRSFLHTEPMTSIWEKCD